jgi:hypothetical protein
MLMKKLLLPADRMAAKRVVTTDYDTRAQNNMNSNGIDDVDLNVNRAV